MQTHEVALSVEDTRNGNDIPSEMERASNLASVPLDAANLRLSRTPRFPCRAFYKLTVRDTEQ